MKWTIEYHNDTGSEDDGFWEWWTVSDGTRNFKCDSADNAEWLSEILSLPLILQVVFKQISATEKSYAFAGSDGMPCSKAFPTEQELRTYYNAPITNQDLVEGFSKITIWTPVKVNVKQ